MAGFTIEEDRFDPMLSEEGVWVDFYNGSRLRLASTESKKYKAALAKAARKHRLLLDSTNDDNFELIQRITCECLAKYVLLGWEGVTMNGQENIPYSFENGVKALTISQKLREFVTEQAGMASNFQLETLAAVKPQSSGT